MCIFYVFVPTHQNIPPNGSTTVGPYVSFEICRHHTGSTTVDPYTSFGFFAIIRVDHRQPLHVIWVFRHHTGRPPSTPTRHFGFSPSYGSTTVGPYTSFEIFRHSTGSTTVDPYVAFGICHHHTGSTTVDPYEVVTVGVPGGESLSFLIFLLPALH